MLAQIDTMAKYHKRLNLLVTSSKPLTPNNVHLAALLSSIPQDWLHFVSALMNQDGVKTKAIVSSLKNEHTR